MRSIDASASLQCRVAKQSGTVCYRYSDPGITAAEPARSAAPRQVPASSLLVDSTFLCTVLMHKLASYRFFVLQFFYIVPIRLNRTYDSKLCLYANIAIKTTCPSESCFSKNRHLINYGNVAISRCLSLFENINVKLTSRFYGNIAISV
jgi:hypothetical protein